MAKSKVPTLDDLVRSVAAKLDEAMTRMDAIEARESAVEFAVQAPTSEATPVASKSTKRTKIASPHEGNANLDALAQLVKRPSKAKFARKAAGHSLDALLTYQNAGGKAARAFMAGEANAILDGRTDMGLVTGSTTYNYVRALAASIGGQPVGKPAGKRRGRPRKS